MDWRVKPEATSLNQKPDVTRSKPASADRLIALDILRGLAVAGMILAVGPGDWSQVYPPLRHAEWNGATMTDMVFPTFLFSVGMALGLGFSRAMAEPGAQARVWRRVLRRSAALIVFGLLIEASYTLTIALGAASPGGGGLADIRLPGILQRIGVCYALAAALLMFTARKREDGRFEIDLMRVSAVIGAVLVGYWAVLRFVPAPGLGAWRLDPAGNLPGYVDRLVFGVSHLWPLGSASASPPATYDPEGLLSTLPATTNVLFGALAATLLRRQPPSALGRLVVAGIVLVSAGLLLDPLFPINKRLWTSSFALLSSGVSTLLLVALMALPQGFARGTLLAPLRVLGGNAILAFLTCTLMSRVASFAFLPGAVGRETPQAWGDHLALHLLPDPKLASLACAVGVLATVTAVLWPLHKRAIHFRL